MGNESERRSKHGIDSLVLVRTEPTIYRQSKTSPSVETGLLMRKRVNLWFGFSILVDGAKRDCRRPDAGVRFACY